MNNIIEVSINKALFVSNLVLNVEFISSFLSFNLHVIRIKIVAVLVILYQLALYYNNSNFLLFFIALYMYSTRAKIDTITLLNNLGLSVLYKVLLKKLKDIILASKLYIKK